MNQTTHARRATRPTRPRGTRAAAALVALATVAGYLAYQLLPFSTSTASSLSTAPPPSRTAGASTARRVSRGVGVSRIVWPSYGQAAVQINESRIHAGPNQHPAPIASVAKVMTAYLVLRGHPLRLGEDGATITLTDADVADTNRRAARDESVVPVRAGEQLSELQALQALLLPSANNIAAVLARWDAGSTGRFVARMNAAARALGMTRTRYTDPSGFDDATVSTAADQLRVVDRAMRLPVFARIVATRSVWLPVAGTVHNTNRLLGQNGFVGVKTGSDRAAGSCFAFRAIHSIDGKQTTITGVVLGQPGSDPVGAGLMAAAAMVDRISGQRSAPGLQQPSPPPLPAPGHASPPQP